MMRSMPKRISMSCRALAWLMVSLSSSLCAAELEPGLIGEYFADTPGFPSATQKTPTLMRIDPQVNVRMTGGIFNKSKLSDNFGVRWSGVLNIPADGSYQFALESDDGSQLSLDGKVVIDNSHSSGMVRMTNSVELVQGAHAILLEYFQGGGSKGCRLLWAPPGAPLVPLPAMALAHDPTVAKAITWDEAAWTNKVAGKYELMDHGPFVSGTFVQPSGLCTAKAVTILLDLTRRNIAIFDSELMRFAYAANDADVSYPPGRDGLDGQPEVIGNDVFNAEASTGWARPGTQDFADPRTDRLGNLPRAWAHYHGLYLCGNSVTLAYSIGDAEIFEHPGTASSAQSPAGMITAITRTITITKNTAALSMLIAENHSASASLRGALGMLAGDDGITLAGVVGGGTISAENGRLTLTVPPGATTLQLAVWHGQESKAPSFQSLVAGLVPSDVTPLTKGGHGRWGRPVVVSGSLGHDSGPYTVDTITVPFDTPGKSYMRLSGHDFFSDGRAAVSTLDGDVWIVSGIDDTLATLTWKRFASGLYQPLGLRIVDDQIYVTCRDRLVRLHDIDGDGEADFYENFNGDCPVTQHYHEFALDLETDAQGNFYYGKSSNLGASDHDATSEMQGSLLKVSKDGSTLTRVCTGLREPNGLGGGDGYPLLTSDNQGNWTPVDRINLIKPGGFYGFRSAAHRTPLPDIYDPPICWTPYDLENSPGGLAFDPTNSWGPFKDIPIGLSYGKSCMFVVLMEEVEGGIPQGGIVFFPLHFASGSMRARFNTHDHQLYVTGLHGWQTSGVQDGCFQRVRYTGMPVYMPTALHIHPDAVEIGFPFALDTGTATDASNIAVEQWNYRWTREYGSDDWSVADPAKKGHDKIEVTAATLSADKKSMTLTIPGLKPVMQMKITIKIAAADGTPVNLTLFNTINKIPKPVLEVSR